LIPLRRTRQNRRECLTLWQKITSSKRSRKAETVGPMPTCWRELLREFWRPIRLMVSFMIFTASIRNILHRSS
jgi:hypothetical protein